MTPSKSARNLDELARLGEEVFDRQVKPSLQPEDDGKFVRGRIPAAEIWLMRAGYKQAYRIMRLSR